VAAQSVTDGHETDDSQVVPVTVVAVHAPTPPVGSVDVTVTPLVPMLPTATQNDRVGHEMPYRSTSLPTDTTSHAPAPPVGFVEVSTLPDPSTAAQNDAVGQDTPVIESEPPMLTGALQTSAAPEAAAEAGVMVDPLHTSAPTVATTANTPRPTTPATPSR
jgi:hypothetical protein